MNGKIWGKKSRMNYSLEWSEYQPFNTKGQLIFNFFGTVQTECDHEVRLHFSRQCAEETKEDSIAAGLLDGSSLGVGRQAPRVEDSPHEERAEGVAYELAQLAQ